MAVSLVLLVAVLFLGDKVNGSRRWFDISFFNVQPSEIAKLAVILWALGDAAAARTLQQEVLDARRRILGDDHPNTLTAKANLAVGEWNSDEHEVAIDLAASALNEGPGSDENAGTVFIYRGSTTGLTDWFYYHQESPALETNEDRDLFGYALSAGDYNGDGKDDVAVGAPGEVRSGVRAHVQSGAARVARHRPKGAR